MVDFTTISVVNFKGERVNLRLPARISSHREFVRCLRKIRNQTSLPTKQEMSSAEYIQRAYYLLAWLVGDAGKGFGSERRHSARIEIHLCRGHPENLELGESVAECIRLLGVECKRLADKPVVKREPHGEFRWLSYFSPIIGWMHCSCLGLAWHQRTSYHAVKMDWVLTAPYKCRMWFIRGLADSDGSVSFRNRCASIITSPNTRLVRAIFFSLKVHNTLCFSKGCGVVSISGREAVRIRLFNPRILTHRRKALEKLLGARAFQRKWPGWLEARVQALLREGLSAPEICHKLLAEDDVYVKIATVKRKKRKLFGKKGAAAEISTIVLDSGPAAR
jgi:hypothetical protein